MPKDALAFAETKSASDRVASNASAFTHKSTTAASAQSSYKAKAEMDKIHENILLPFLLLKLAVANCWKNQLYLKNAGSVVIRAMDLELAMIIFRC